MTGKFRAKYMVCLSHCEDIFAVLHLVHAVGNGNPHVVRGSRLQRFGKSSLPERESARNIQLVIVIPANGYLVSFFIHQHHAVIAVFRISLITSVQDDADRIVRTVLTLENVLSHIRGHVRHIAQLGIISRNRDEVISLPVGLGEIKAFFRMERGHRTEGICIINGKAVHGKIAIVFRIIDRYLGMVTEHFNIVSRSAHLLGYVLFLQLIGGIVTCETRPANHTSGRTFEQCHHFRFRLVAELVLLEIRHHLIGNKMYGPGILGHFGLERSRVDRFLVDICIYSRDEKTVTVETEQRHVLHAATIGVDRTGGHFLHGRNICAEPERHVAFAGCG